MKQEAHDESDGRRVWLTEEEADLLMNTADGTEEKIAFGLALRCGLRVGEVVNVTPLDVVETGAGQFVRVRQGKGDKYREAPIPHALSETISAFADVGDVDPDEPLVERPTRWVQRRVERARNELRAETGDEGWQYVTPHDLRRSWGQHLLDAGVEPGMVMQWGGWESWKTFREHYLGIYSLKRQRAEREKIGWMS